MSDLDRLACSDYIPTPRDILQLRIPTTGINEYIFDLEFDSRIFRFVEYCLIIPHFILDMHAKEFFSNNLPKLQMYQILILDP